MKYLSKEQKIVYVEVRKKIKKDKTEPVLKLTNEELDHYSLVASDSIHLMDALFDNPNLYIEIDKVKLAAYVKEIVVERKSECENYQFSYISG